MKQTFKQCTTNSCSWSSS